MNCKPYCFMFQVCIWPCAVVRGRTRFAKALVCERCGAFQPRDMSNDRGVNWTEVEQANRRRR
jgi:hypothetical protein